MFLIVKSRMKHQKSKSQALKVFNVFGETFFPGFLLFMLCFIESTRFFLDRPSIPIEKGESYPFVAGGFAVGSSTNNTKVAHLSLKHFLLRTTPFQNNLHQRQLSPA